MYVSANVKYPYPRSTANVFGHPNGMKPTCVEPLKKRTSAQTTDPIHQTILGTSRSLGVDRSFDVRSCDCRGVKMQSEGSVKSKGTRQWDIQRKFATITGISYD